MQNVARKTIRMVMKVTRVVAPLLAAGATGSAWAESDYINANFYYVNNGNAYTAVTMNNDQSDSNNSGSEGWSSYAVQGKYWNDVDIGSSAAQSVKTYDSSAESLSESSVTVTISGSRGGYFSAAGFDHHILSGYIDDNENNTSPLVTFANIPFDYYKVVVYFAADGASTRFGYITLNDTVNLYGDGTGTDIGIDADGWGGCAAQVNSQNNFQPGQNILVSPVLKNTTSSTLKVQSRSYFPGATYRSGIAAIQVVKAEAPAACTYTVSEGGTYDLFGDGATSYWSASEPSTGSEAVTISISGDTTLTVNDSRVFASLTVTGSGTLTLAGTGEIVTPSVTVNSGVTLLKTTGQLSTSAAVSVPESSALEIANSCTWSGVISGAGSVKVSANHATFSAANTYTGGLVVASGGLAKSENSTGWGSKTVMAVTVQSGGTLDISGEYSTGYNFFIAGTGVDSQGALVNSTAITYGGNLPGNLTLSADATIDCFNAFGVGGGNSLNLNGHILTIKATSAETAKQFYVHGSYMNGGTTADTGKIVLQSNVQLYSNNGNGISSGQQAILLEAQSGSSVSVGASSSNFPVSNTTIADGAALTVDGTLNLQNGKTLAVNGTANISGTANIGQSGNAGSHLFVGGTVNVNGSGTIKLVSTSYITKNGNGVINIAANAQVQWINHNWDTNAGDIFRGDGTMWFDCSGGDYSCTTAHEFGGKLKVTTRTGSNRYAFFSVTNLGQYSGRPELRLECGTEASMGQFRFARQSKNTTFNVRNFSGWGEIYPNSSDAGTWTINSLQESDTEFSGVFKKFETVAANSAIVVHGNAGEVKSLTFSGASTTEGSATVQDNAKLIFSSTGSWANGTVAVANGGYLEVNNPSAVASTLNLQSGGTIKIATYTTTETVGEEEVETLHTRTITAGTVTFPDSGEAAIDISAIPDLGENETATIITASTSLDSDISKLRLVGKPYSLQVNGNSLEVINDGGLKWDSANDWGTKDVTKYSDATITVSSASDTVTLTADMTLDTMTITGSGTVSFSSTDSETISVSNISIGSGVTLDASAALSISAGATISGEGTINIPDGVTLTLDGVNCSAKITAQNGGILVTKGTKGATELSNENNNFAYGSLINVLTGKATVNAHFSAYNSAGRGFHGNITIAEGATFENSKTESFDRNADSNHPILVDVYGTLAFGTTRWTLGDYNTIRLHDNARITGSGDSAGALDVESGVSSFTFDVQGNATNAAPMRIRGNKILMRVSEGKNLTLSGGFVTHNTGAVMEVVSGQVTSTSLPPFKTKIDTGATFTLKDAVWSGSTADKFSGEGTLELLSTTGDSKSHTATGSTFNGILKLSNSGGIQCNLNPSGAATFTTTPELILNASNTHLGDGYYRQQSATHGPLAVRDLSGSGYFYAPWGSAAAYSYIVQVKQTKDTVFDGYFYSTHYNYDRIMNLTVTGDGTESVHSLTLNHGLYASGNADSSEANSVLTVQDYGKVVFGGTGGTWGTGQVVVGANGYLESENVAAVTKLTLQDGANIVFPASLSKLSSISALTFASGTTKIHFGSGVTPTAGTLINWSAANLEAAPAGEFALADSTLAGEWILTKSADGLSIAAAGAQIVYSNGDIVPYTTMDNETLVAYMTAIGTDEGATLRILDNTAIDATTIEQLALQNLYYDSTTKTISKAVAKVNTAVYPSLASAVAAAADGDSVYLQRASTETITINAKAITLVQTAAFSGSITGSGTLILTAFTSTSIVGDGWTGTVWLKNISSGNIVPANYGNVNSTIRFTGVTGTIAQNETFTPAVELVDDGDTKALTIDCTTGYAANTATFSAIKGSGTFVTSSSNDKYPRTTFKVLDWSNFTGALNIDRGRLVFGTDTISADSWRYIYVSAGVNVTIASGKTWNATEGVVVKGTLNMPSTASMTVNKYSGDGTVNITGTPANDPSLTFSSWTGTFVLPDFTSNAMFNLTAYGTSGSWIKLNDFRPGWLKVAALSISANLLLEGDFILTAMNGGSAFSFQTVSGSGNISLTSSAAPASITIANLAEFTGSIANSSGASLVITKRTLAETPSVDDCILVSSTPDNVSVVGVYVGETQQDVLLEKKSDGIYVAATKSTDTVDNETVTVLDTGSNTAIDATGVIGKVAIPGTVAQITGVTAANLLLKVTYTPDGESETTSYYSGILSVDGSGNVSLDGSATVGGVKVQPETAEDSPMTFTGSSPSFTVKTIPGLWYQVLAADSVDNGALVSPAGGTAVQATTTTVSPAAPAFSGTVKFYKIAVGASRAALEQP